MLPLVLIAVPAVGALLAWLAGSLPRRLVLLVAVSLLHLGTTVSLWITGGTRPGGWLAVDAWGLLVLTVLSVLFLAVAIYSVAFLARRGESARSTRNFVTGLLAFLATSTTVALAHHLALLWIGMEATTLALAPLVIHRPDRRSLEAVWKYLVLSSVGIALALLGTFFLAAAQQSGRPLMLEDLVTPGARFQPGLLRAAFVFLLVGYGTKMGLAPLHAWKPDTYGEAPGPVGALLAGGLTSCAFLGLVRIVSIMHAAHDFAFVRPPLLALGLFSMVIGAGFMLCQTDLKRLLAYSSVEHMGILAIALAIGGSGNYGSALHVVNNGLIKGLLFLVVGNIVWLYGSPRASEITGVLQRAPRSGALAIAGLFAVTGSPPFGLFISEFTILGAALRGGLTWVAVIMLVLLAAIFVGMAGMILEVVYGDPPHPGPPERERPATVVGPLLLVSLVLLLGLYLPPSLRAVLADAAGALGGGAP